MRETTSRTENAISDQAGSHPLFHKITAFPRHLLKACDYIGNIGVYTLATMKTLIRNDL